MPSTIPGGMKWCLSSINRYAVFMGYLMMGVRGLGLLVVTWTTVVLLGGFVSNLQKKDFWCLTVITLVETAGVFNFLLREKLSDIVLSLWILAETTFYGTVGKDERKSRVMMGTTLAVDQVFVLGIILFPFGILYMLGLYISAGASLWRLIEHDFGDAGGANQKPALQLLYGLGVAQGVLFGYKTIHALGARNMLVQHVARHATVDEEAVAEYLEETVAGCEKDPSFARGRNLVTYAVNLMEAKSNEGFISGIRVLSGAIREDKLLLDDVRRARKVLAKQLLTTSDSWNHMVQRLLETVGPRSPYSRELREQAARVLDIIARGIRLEQFPRGIECISSMLDTSAEEEYNQQGSRTDLLRRNYGNATLEAYSEQIDGNLKDYERVEQLEEYELDYLVRDCNKNPKDSPLIPFLSDLVQCPVQLCLLCKTEQPTGESSKRKEAWWDNKVRVLDLLLKEALNIIHHLTAFDEFNRRIIMIMSNTVLLHKIADLPRKLHRDNHRAHDKFLLSSELKVLVKCWVLTVCLVDADVDKEANRQRQILEEGQPAAPAVDTGGGDEVEEEGEKECRHLRSKIGSAIEKAVKNILDCVDCPPDRKMHGINILLHLPLDMSVITVSGSRTRRLTTWILALISYHGCSFDEYWMVPGFTCRNNDMPDDTGIRHLAGKRLSDIMLQEEHDLPSEESARELQSILLAITDIATAFSNDAEDTSVITHAARIIEYLFCFSSYAVFHALAGEVNTILVGTFEKAIQEVLNRCGSTEEERQAQEATDVEQGGVSEVKGGCTDEERLREALVSLCWHACIGQRNVFEKVASAICDGQGKSLQYFKSLVGLIH